VLIVQHKNQLWLETRQPKKKMLLLPKPRLQVGRVLKRLRLLRRLLLKMLQKKKRGNRVLVWH
jgi:hypothetical protein